MARIRIHSFTISLDGYGAGPLQTRDNPLGIGGESLHGWLVGTRTFKQMQRKDGGTTGTDDDFAARGFAGIGAWILGRNMFGPVRGPWPDETWRGWWGENPPYHAPVFVLTSYPREPLVMQGGTVFHFVTGGVSTIRQHLQARLVDEMHLAIAPILLGGGEHLTAGLDLPALGYTCREHVPTEMATHVVLARQDA